MIRPLYKAQEPFMEAPAAHGFLGVIMYDDKEDKVQCHICGKWMEHVGGHINKAHGVSGEDYKDRFGLAQRIALCGSGYSAKRREIADKGVASGTFKAVMRAGEHTPRRIAYRRNPKVRPGNSALSVKNRHGLCELQMFGRYEVVKKIVGREPLSPDLQKYDSQLLGAIYKSYESLNKYKKHIGRPEWKKGAHEQNSDIELVAHLRKWAHEHKRRPTAKDFQPGSIVGRGYPRYLVFFRRFGSWSNALQTAGIK